jgi:hypothetical protein
MREQTPVSSRRRLDAATFDAALERVVARVVEAPADDTAGGRVVARLRAAPSWHTAVPRVMLAPAAVLLAVAVVVFAQRGPSSSDEMAGPVRPDSAAAIAVARSAPVPAAPAGAADAGDSTREARLLLIGATPGATASGARRRSRARRSTAPVDDGTAVPPIDGPQLIDISGLNAAGDQRPGVIALPLDALVLSPLEASDLDRDQ